MTLIRLRIQAYELVMHGIFEYNIGYISHNNENALKEKSKQCLFTGRRRHGLRTSLWKQAAEVHSGAVP